MFLQKRLLAFAPIAILALAAIVTDTHVAEAKTQCGRASWYALTSKTASGERMDPSKMTAAHRGLPFGSRVLVTNKANGRSAVVRINDRGPFIRGRIVDVSKAAAHKLGFVSAGHAAVCLKVIG